MTYRFSAFVFTFVMTIGSQMQAQQNLQDDDRCGILSIDGSQEIWIEDSLTQIERTAGTFISAAELNQISASSKTVQIEQPGLRIMAQGNRVTLIVLKNDNWQTHDGLVVGMTEREILAHTGFEGRSFDHDGSIGYIGAGGFSNPHRVCTVELQLNDARLLKTITLNHSPMSVSPAQPVAPIKIPSPKQNAG